VAVDADEAAGVTYRSDYTRALADVFYNEPARTGCTHTSPGHLNALSPTKGAGVRGR
jgi:hypothetical protein